MTFAHRAGFGLAGRSEPNSAAGPDLLLGVSIFDYTGRILFWSDGATEITGYGASVLLGRDISLLSVDAHHDPVDLTQFVTRDGTGLSRIRHADGTVRVVEWRVYPIKMDDGTPVIVGIIIDISAKEHTISNFGMLDAFFKQSHVGLAILDTQLRFVLLNEALAALNHRPLSDHIGRHFAKLLTPPRSTRTKSNSKVSWTPDSHFSICGYPARPPPPATRAKCGPCPGFASTIRAEPPWV